MVIIVSNIWLTGAYVLTKTESHKMAPTWSTYACSLGYSFDIGDPFYDQLTAVKSRYHMTISWTKVRTSRGHAFVEVDR